jgi:hypothetical protein
MVDAPWASRLQDMADLTTPMAIRVAATLRIADHIADGVYSLEALAAKTNANPQALGRVMSHLAAVDVFHEPESGVYELADLGKELCDQGAGDARTWLDLGNAVGRADLALVTLLDVVLTGERTWTAEHDPWGELDADPELSDSFDDQMASGAAAKAPGLAAGYPWSSVRHVIDVGGGNGTLLTALLKAFQHLTGTVVDRPGPVATATRKFASAGVNASGVPQSFFDPLPSGADVYLLSGILHDWDDESASRILRRCAEAAGEQGTVLVMESLVDPADHRSSTTDLDLLMLVTTGGRTRTISDFQQMGADVGLTVKSVVPLAPPHSLVEFTATAGGEKK